MGVPRGTARMAVAAALLGVAAVAPGHDTTRGTAAAVPAPATVRFLVKGDWGWGGPAQADVTRRMCAEQRARPGAFVLTTGDNFYNPDGVANAANFTVPERCLRAAGVRWRAAWGNHDLGGTGTVTALGGARHWYSFASGPVRVIVLDANVPGDPAQLAFLTRTLRITKQPVRVVAFHQPAYTMGLHGPGTTQQRLWAPLFRRWGVALVLQGHNHDYERFVVDGVTYITTGGGGAPVYPCVRPAPQGATAARCSPVNHFLAVQADATGLNVTAIGLNGAVVERVRVPARTPAA